jgi:uncharacterized membrane protein
VSPVASLLPLGAAFGYALGALAIQRALGLGASVAVVNLVCNLVMGLLFQALWLLPGAAFPLHWVLCPVLCGGLFFLGQIMTFRAIKAGDASVSTPILGTKVLFVALFAVLLTGIPLPVSWWWACLMASTGIALISYGGHGSGSGLGKAILWSLGAAAVFALTDVLVQTGVPKVGYARFAPIMFGAMSLLSFSFLPEALKSGIFAGAKKPSVERDHHHSGFRPWLLGGSILLSVQALALYSAIGMYGSATMTNILYGSRCLWSVILLWLFTVLMIRSGHPDHERATHVHRAMARRLTGAVLLVLAMALVLRSSGR